jgi:hypothetical protein
MGFVDDETGERIAGSFKELQHLLDPEGAAAEDERARVARSEQAAEARAVKEAAKGGGQALPPPRGTADPDTVRGFKTGAVVRGDSVRRAHVLAADIGLPDYCLVLFHGSVKGRPDIYDDGVWSDPKVHDKELAEFIAFCVVTATHDHADELGLGALFDAIRARMPLEGEVSA